MSETNKGSVGVGRLAWALLVILAVLLSGCGGAQSSQEERPSRSGEEQGEAAGGGAGLGAPSLGDDGAPVVMREYADFQ